MSKKAKSRAAKKSWDARVDIPAPDKPRNPTLDWPFKARFEDDPRAVRNMHGGRMHWA